MYQTIIIGGGVSGLGAAIYAKRFGDKKTGKITVDLRLTQKDLSAQSGIARETVGRIIKTLKSKKLIVFQNKKLIINDLRGLEEKLS